MIEINEFSLPMNDMRHFLYPIFFLAALSSFASDFLDSKYNSFRADYSIISDHGFEASANGYGLNYKPENLDVIFGYSISNSNYDEILETDVTIANIESELSTFGIGFLFRKNDIDIIPSLKLGSGQISVLSTDVADVNYAEAAITIRVSASDNLVMNLGFHHITYGNVSISNSQRTNISNQLSNMGYNSLTDSEFDSLESDHINDTTILNISADQRLSDNFFASYGLSMEDIFSKARNPRISFGIGYSY